MRTIVNDQLRSIAGTEQPQSVMIARPGPALAAALLGFFVITLDALVVNVAGHIQAGGIAKDVTFVDETDPSVNDQIDAVYRAKYRRYPSYVPPMINLEARATTLKLVPR